MGFLAFGCGCKALIVARGAECTQVNALAILSFLAQLPGLTNLPWTVYAMTAGGLAIIYGLPYLTRAVP